MRSEFSATRGEIRSGDEQVVTTLREEIRDSNEQTVLVVDEAQSLPAELLEEIRLLANIETNDDKLMTLIIAGQPELAERLNDQSLRQLKQRIALRCALRSLSPQETAAYIAGRYVPIEQIGGLPIPGILPGAAAFMLLVGVLAALGPARRGLRIDPTEALRSE